MLGKRCLEWFANAVRAQALAPVPVNPSHVVTCLIVWAERWSQVRLHASRRFPGLPKVSAIAVSDRGTLQASSMEEPGAMAESVSRGDHNLEFLEIVKLEFRQLREQLVDHVCREVREFMNSKHDGHGPLHVRHEQHLQVLPLPTDGTASAESCKRFNRSDCSETSSEQAPEIPEEGSDWLYRPGKAFAPSRMLKKIGEDDMIKRTSSFGGLITLKRRFSGQAFEQPLWDEGSKRFVKDLSHHSHHPLRNAGTAFPSVPDVPNVPAPALEVEPAMGALEEAPSLHLCFRCVGWQRA